MRSSYKDIVYNVTHFGTTPQIRAYRVEGGRAQDCVAGQSRLPHCPLGLSWRPRTSNGHGLQSRAALGRTCSQERWVSWLLLTSAAVLSSSWISLSFCISMTLFLLPLKCIKNMLMCIGAVCFLGYLLPNESLKFPRLKYLLSYLMAFLEAVNCYPQRLPLLFA